MTNERFRDTEQRLGILNLPLTDSLFHFLLTAISHLTNVLIPIEQCFPKFRKSILGKHNCPSLTFYHKLYFALTANII